ncbi:MAG: ATP-binding protein [Bacillota bacterium]|nr:ATP-binding protein [Bacillota bacterium]
MFVCRDKELEELQYRYDGGKFECMIIYGRRRVGKTALINEFCKDKDVIYYPALKETTQGNLEVLSAAIQEYKDPKAAGNIVYGSFQDAFQEIGRLSEEKRIVFVIDEFPYLAKADQSIASRLQHLIDLSWKNGKMFLILCGSSVSFMEDQVLAYESPLYGRRTGQIKLEPLNYLETSEMNPGLDPETQSLVYGITGGIPLYVEKLDVRSDIDQALLRNLFNPASYLYEEPENLLRQELREPAVYNSVVKAVADGATKLGEIATRAGIDKSSCSTYVKTLMNLGIICKETPANEKEGSKSIYKINDHFFRFWYRFVPRNIAAIQTGRISKIYRTSVKEHLHQYMGTVFEDMCAQYILNYMEELPIELSALKRWWGTDPKEHKAIEIDLIGMPVKENRKRSKEYMAVSCKYRNRPASIADLKELQEYCEVFDSNATYHYYIFSAFGFKEELASLAETEGVKLVSLDDMYHHLT